MHSFLPSIAWLLAASALPATALAQKSPRPAPISANTVQGTIAYARSAEAMQFAQDMAERHELNPDWVREMVGQARFLPKVPALMLPSGQFAAKNWNLYRSRFVEPVRIRAGVNFWKKHRTTLAKAEQTYGVPIEILVGIIGVETIYGQQMGNYRVLDALATLTFDFPAAHPRAQARQAYFQGELEQFLLLAQQTGISPLVPRGSYAGAMGLGQFMPSSWMRYAVDGNGDGQIDLFADPQDAIHSVANYFVAHGWQQGMPTHYRIDSDPNQADLETLLAPDIRPSFSALQMAEYGLQLEPSGQTHPGLLALIELKNGPKPASYVAGTANFYAVTRYNWSSYYAMAVIELGQAIAQAVRRNP